MTNEQRQRATEAANKLKTKLEADKLIIQKLREAAQALAGAALDMEVCLANTIQAANRVALEPKAEQMRNLTKSEQHLDASPHPAGRRCRWRRSTARTR